MTILVDVMIKIEKFQGNSQDYYNIHNSYLDKVCMTKKGNIYVIRYH